MGSLSTYSSLKGASLINSGTPRQLKSNVTKGLRLEGTMDCGVASYCSVLLKKKI